ncbi:MAG: hypothetical protein CVT49_13540 [candidate division Zixibacteria bacterium HGW-Zixibacteria-1]|nr:MAG: hypothetical protein CVT49_13540 [candidate division Zixibacteria bacterium HGW-Zixibacteria-1]
MKTKVLILIAILLHVSLVHSSEKVYLNLTGHYYYKIIIPPYTTWHQCRDSAIALGGYLATANSQEENNFLAQLAYPYITFLGGTDEDSEGQWHWITDEEWSLTAWRQGEPNNAWSDEDYIGLSPLDSQWNDMRNWFLDTQVFIIECEMSTDSVYQNGDVNCDGLINLLDIIHTINYLYKSGPPPCAFIGSAE